jgi:hypothetical protein
MRRIRQFASPALIAATLAVGWGAVCAQDRPQEGIERNLLQRQQSEREFHVKLFDAPAAPTPAPTSRLPLPRAFTERESYQAPPAIAREPANAPPAAVRSPISSQLDDSQTRRQLELQIQTVPLSEVARQQQSQIQQSQFARENQAHDLQEGILRNSSDSMQRLH